MISFGQFIAHFSTHRLKFKKLLDEVIDLREKPRPGSPKESFIPKSSSFNTWFWPAVHPKLENKRFGVCLKGNARGAIAFWCRMYPGQGSNGSAVSRVTTKGARGCCTQKDFHGQRRPPRSLALPKEPGRF